MRHFALTVSALFLFACATAQSAGGGASQGAVAPAQGPPANTTQSESADGTVQATISVQDGSSFERAIVIDASNEMEGVPLEYKWVAEHFPGYRMQKQALTRHEGKPFDILHITDASGAPRMLYFDISSFFGKM